MTERRGDAEIREQEQQENQGPIVRDRRRIDPETGAVREPVDRPAPAAPAGGAGSGTPGQQADAAVGGEQVRTLEAQLAERTADLQRVQAEYANYRKRVERDRVAMREQALASVLAELLPVLDDIGRARDHGELQGGFRQVGEALEQTVAKLGLVRFGEKGEPFDPTVHEALMHSFSDDVTETTCVEVLLPGYRVGDRVLRPARVAVAEPLPEGPPAETAAEERSNVPAPSPKPRDQGAGTDQMEETERTDVRENGTNGANTAGDEG